MNRYIKVEVCSANEVDKFLEKGWEIIETTKTHHDIGETTLNYHLGYPLTSKINDLKNIIHLYEKYDLKDELLKKVADYHGDNLDDYDFGGPGHYVNNDLTRFIEMYESSVNDKETKVYKKLSSEEIAERYGL